MDHLSEVSGLTFHPNTLQVVRKMFELDKPGEMDKAIDILQEWLKQQNYIVKKDFSRDCLERTLITTKGSVERAKERIDKYCTMRILLPHMFGNYDIKNDFKELFNKVVVYGIVPRLTAEHYRVIIGKCLGPFSRPELLINHYQAYIIFTEYIRRHDYSAGVIFVMDVTHIDFLSFAKNIDIISFRHFIVTLLEGYGVRAKAIHILSPSKMVDMFVNILKQALTAKLADRVQVHKTIDSVYDQVPRAILPSDYGGNEISTEELHNEWLEILSTKENTAYRREMENARTDESLRPADQFNQQHMGMPGTFKTLNVD